MQLNTICQIYSEVGLSAFQSGDIQMAETMLAAGVQEVERQNLRCSAALGLLQNLALTYYRQRRLKEAAQILEKAMKMSKQIAENALRPTIGLALADVYFELGRNADSEDLYRKFINKAARTEALRPRLKKYAFLLSESGKVELARATLQML